MKIRDETIEALKLAEVLMPPWLRGIYQLLIAGLEAAWKELDENNAKEERT